MVTETWQLAEIVGNVDTDATRITFGVMMSGGGVAWYDDLEVSIEDSNGAWKHVEVKDAGFESADLFHDWKPGTGNPSETSTDGWNVTLDSDTPAEGHKALRIEPATTLLVDELFLDAPLPAEAVDIDLGRGLRARVPLSLYSRNGHTVGDDSSTSPHRAEHQASNSSGLDRIAAIADVIIVWNVLEHFWPYWDIVRVDWSAELDRALVAALSDRTTDEHATTLRRLSTVAADGHAVTTCPGAAPRARLPCLVDVVDRQVVVTATANSALALGDVIVSIDGRLGAIQLEEDEARISGSPQWRRASARQEFGMGAPHSTARLRVRRGTLEFELTVTRDSYSLHEFSHPAIEHLTKDVYYIDLERAGLQEIQHEIEKLADAQGIVFDLRNYPNYNHEVLSYLIDHPIELAEGMAIPHIIRPDHVQRAVLNWTTDKSSLAPLQPHIRGRVAFLTGPSAISYAETVMELVEHHHLGAIVGSATAGTNGNIAEISAPTGCRTTFTGLRANKPDGSRFHLVGVEPTILATRTLAGIAAGRDEVLERALAYVRADAK